MNGKIYIKLTVMSKRAVCIIIFIFIMSFIKNIIRIAKTGNFKASVYYLIQDWDLSLA